MLKEHGHVNIFGCLTEKFGRLAIACLEFGLEKLWNYRIKVKFQEHGKTYAELRELGRSKRKKTKELNQLVFYLLSVLIFMVALGFSAFTLEILISWTKRTHRGHELGLHESAKFIYVH